MSGAMRRIGEYLGLLEDTGRYDDEYDGEYDGQTGQYASYSDHHSDQYDTSDRMDAHQARQPKPVKQPKAPKRQPAPVADLAERRRPVVVPTPVTDFSRIVTLHPTTYNEARAIGEHYRDGVPVIMNLSEMEDADAKRLVDFAAGLIFATRGNIERVTNKVFLLSPPNVSIAAEEKQRLAQGGFFNQS
jgi:cell division inhibitor SepF